MLASARNQSWSVRRYTPSFAKRKNRFLLSKPLHRQRYCLWYQTELHLHNLRFIHRKYFHSTWSPKAELVVSFLIACFCGVILLQVFLHNYRSSYVIFLRQNFWRAQQQKRVQTAFAQLLNASSKSVCTSFPYLWELNTNWVVRYVPARERPSESFDVLWDAIPPNIFHLDDWILLVDSANSFVEWLKNLL